MSTHLASPPLTGELAASPATIRRTGMNIARSDPERAAIIRRGDVANMNIAETATYLDLSIATVRRAVDARRITCVRIGSRLLFRKADLDRDLAKLAVPAL